MQQPVEIFDRLIKRLHRDRSLGLLNDQTDFLLRESAQMIAECFDYDIASTFPRMVDLGARLGYVSSLMQGKAGVETIYELELSQRLLQQARQVDSYKVVADEEYLPLAGESVNLVTSSLSLHWANDLPGVLIQIFRALKERGLFIGTIFGPETLIELREVITQAEIHTKNGISPRISPFLEVKEAGALLQRAGYKFPVTDSTKVTVHYPDVMTLCKDIRAMGESNALHTRLKSFTSRSLFAELESCYQDMFAITNAEGQKVLPVTFEIVMLTGWKS